MKWIAIALVCAACAPSPATDNFNHPFGAWVPRDVRIFVIDAQACRHFSGEYGDDEARKAFLKQMVEETCANLDKRKAELSHKYTRLPRVQKLIVDVTE